MRLIRPSYIRNLLSEVCISAKRSAILRISASESNSSVSPSNVEAFSSIAANESTTSRFWRLSEAIFISIGVLLSSLQNSCALARLTAREHRTSSKSGKPKDRQFRDSAGIGGGAVSHVTASHQAGGSGNCCMSKSSYVRRLTMLLLRTVIEAKLSFYLAYTEVATAEVQALPTNFNPPSDSNHRHVSGTR